MKYTVEIKEVIRKYVEVEASSEDEALEIVDEDYAIGAIDMFKDVLMEMDCTVVS